MSAAGQPKRLPSVQVKNRLGLACVRRAVEEWLALDPAEAQRWRQYMRFLTEAHEWTGGWTESREMLTAGLGLGHAPSFIIFRTKRLLIEAGWDPEEARFWDVETVGGKNAPSSLWKEAVRELLPEMVTARKERMQQYHRGVSLPS